MSIQLAKETCAGAQTTATRSIVVDRHKDYDPDEPMLSQDSYHMGHKLGTNVHLLFATHPSEEMKYLVVVNSKTGESVMLHFGDGAAPPQTTLEETVKSIIRDKDAEIGDLRAQRDALRRESAGLETGMRQALDKCDMFYSDCECLRRELRSRDDIIETLRGENEDLHHANRSVSANLAGTKADLDGMSRQSLSHFAEVVGLKGEIAALTESFQSATKGYADALLKLAEMKGRLDAANTQLKNDIA